MSAARDALWRDAQALSAAAGPQLSPRMRRLAVRSDRPLGLAEIGQAPVWASGDPAERARLTRLTGAVLVSQRWSREISGVVLGRAAKAVGDEALEDLINLPSVVAPEVSDSLAASGDADALDRLGASALIAASVDRPPQSLRDSSPRGGASGLVPTPQGEVAPKGSEGGKCGLTDRLAHLFPAGVAAPVKPAAAALALRTAEGLHRQADDAGAAV